MNLNPYSPVRPLRAAIIVLVATAAIIFGLITLTANSGCSTAPAQRVVQVQSLKAVGHTAETAVELSAQLYRDGKITPAQARQVIDFYDQKFQPAYRLAVAAVNANLDSLASPDLMALAAQLSNLVSSLQNHSP